MNFLENAKLPKIFNLFVGTCTIDNDIFKIGIRLAHHAFDGSAQSCRVVAVDGDDGEFYHDTNI